MALFLLPLQWHGPDAIAKLQIISQTAKFMGCSQLLFLQNRLVQYEPADK